MPSELAVTNDLLAQLKADAPWWETFDAIVPSTPPGAYAVVWPRPGMVISDRLGYRPTGLLAAWQIVCAGTSRAQVMDLVRAVRDRLGGWVPYPADRSSGRVVEVPSTGALLSDTQAGETRFSLTLTFQLSTTRS